MQLSLVLPAFNEEKNIENTINDVLTWFQNDQIDGEVIVVDDGSTDSTPDILSKIIYNKQNIRVVTHQHNRGYGAAVRSGLDNATKEYSAFMDSDGQFKAVDFNKLIPFLTDYDFVTGRKIKRADPFIRRINAKFYALLVFLILGVWVRDINCAMKIFKTSIWLRIRPEYGLGALFNGEVFYRLKINGLRWKQVFVNHYPRRFGTQTGANIKVIAGMFKDLYCLKRNVKKES